MLSPSIELSIKPAGLIHNVAAPQNPFGCPMLYLILYHWGLGDESEVTLIL